MIHKIRTNWKRVTPTPHLNVTGLLVTCFTGRAFIVPIFFPLNFQDCHFFPNRIKIWFHFCIFCISGALLLKLFKFCIFCCYLLVWHLTHSKEMGAGLILFIRFRIPNCFIYVHIFTIFPRFLNYCKYVLQLLCWIYDMALTCWNFYNSTQLSLKAAKSLNLR